MKRSKGMNALLVEIMLAVLFFALCSAAIMEIFAYTKNVSVDSNIKSRAMIYIQDITEKMYTTKDMCVILKCNGFVFENGEWNLKRDGYDVSVQLSEEKAYCGTIVRAVITANGENGTIAQVPCVRYFSGEVN